MDSLECGIVQLDHLDGNMEVGFDVLIAGVYVFWAARGRHNHCAAHGQFK